MLVAQETLVNKNRLSLPIIIFDLDGVSGYWDEAKVYHVRQATICLLVALSCNFRLIAIATGHSKNKLRRLCKILSEKDATRP